MGAGVRCPYPLTVHQMAGQTGIQLLPRKTDNRSLSTLKLPDPVIEGRRLIHPTSDADGLQIRLPIQWQI